MSMYLSNFYTIYTDSEKSAKLTVWCLDVAGSPISHHENMLYNIDPLKPHLYIVKLGFTGVYIIFLISAKNIDCEYSLEPPRRGGSNEYSQFMFSPRRF